MSVNVWESPNTWSESSPEGEISFIVKKPLFNASGNATLPQPSATVAFISKKPLFNVSGTATLPQPSGSIAFSSKKLIFNISGSVSGFEIPSLAAHTITLQAASNIIKL